MNKFIHDFKAGDIVNAHGGKFCIITDAGHSTSHLPMIPNGEHAGYISGATTCAVAYAICIEGECRGYFSPGTTWTFQGNFKAGQYTVD